MKGPEVFGQSHPDIVLLAALLKKVASASNPWLGERLGIGGANSVSSLVTRFQRQGLAHTAEFERPIRDSRHDPVRPPVGIAVKR